MKNRDKLRTMTFNGETYLWAYYFDDKDFSNYPYSYYLFVPKDNNKLKVRVYFTRYAPNMDIDAYSREGSICFYKGEEIILNLCRPFFARQIIEYVFEYRCNKSYIGEIDIKDGDTILETLGYTGFD
ncbi:MAG: hypothetical protein ACI4JK_09725 [Oscillospiraceae bacterium]